MGLLQGLLGGLARVLAAAAPECAGICCLWQVRSLLALLAVPFPNSMPLPDPSASPFTVTPPPRTARFGTVVAAKVLKASSEIAVNDFRAEIEILQRVHHPNCVQVWGSGVGGRGG